MSMSGHSPSQCYQAVRRHIRPHYDSIWITDSFLSSAFERYAATLRTGARHGSSVPGPMEHRKRLAKRHMGDLHFGQSHSAAPIWDLANLVDLSQWQWKPPTPPAARRQKTASTSELRTISDTVLSPLRSFLPYRLDKSVDPEPEDELLPHDVVLTSVADLSTFWGADSSPADIISAGLIALSQDVLNNTRDATRFSRFCDSWQQALIEGEFHGGEVCHVLTGLIGGLSGKPFGTLAPRSAEQKKLLLLQATIEGIAQRESDENVPSDHLAWNGILSGVGKIQLNTLRVFTRAMACVPEGDVKLVAPGILDNLYSYLDGLGRANKRPTFARQAAKMAVPLKGVGGSNLRFISDLATRKILQDATIESSTYTNIRYGWLLLLARLPGMEVDYLAQVCVALEARQPAEPLSELEICQILLVWANSRTPLELYTRLYNTLDTHGTKCYRALGARLWETRQFHRITPFIKFLHIIGRENAIGLLAQGVVNTQRGGAVSLANMALGMRRPRAAIEILCLYEESRKCESRFWESRLGFKALERLVWTPDFNHRRLLVSLGITPTRNSPTRHYHYQLRADKARRRLSSHQISRVAAVGAVVGLSPHLSKRQAFFFITSCYRHLREHYSRASAPLVRALIHNVTRSLSNGEPGITTRLRYVLFIIRKELGDAAYQDALLAIGSRREANIKRLRNEGSDMRYRQFF
ncbi:hypothetical protein GGS20DRAFT_471361 [Poronia punctata]|nr:hypothetical protein GGS20DRAFT_471361 [Poronia punctata]